MSSPSDRLAELQTLATETILFITARIRKVFTGTFDISRTRWLRLAGMVLLYIIVRPLIVKASAYLGGKELAWRKAREDNKKDQARMERKKAAKEGGGKARMGANELRTGGRVLGEVEDDGEGGEVLVSEGIRRRVPEQKVVVSEELQEVLDRMESDDDVEDLVTGAEPRR